MTRRLAGLLLALCLCAHPVLAAAPLTPLMPLTLGFYMPGIRDANPADVRVSLQLWLEEIAKPYRLEARALMYEDMQQLHRAAQDGLVNLIVAPGMELTQNFRPEELMEGFSARRRGGDTGLALIVRKNSSLTRFADLRGKRVVRLGDDLLSNIFLETQCHHVARSPCANWFDIIEEDHDAQAIYKVFFGKADAALVSLSALNAAGELNPQVRERLRVLLDWKVKSLSFGMLSVNSDPEFRERMLRSAMQVTGTPRGKQIMGLFKTDYMERAGVSDLQPFWALQREYMMQRNR